VAVSICLLVAAGALGAEDELARNLKELKHRDPERRVAALEYLAQKRYPDTLGAVAGALRDREVAVRVAAARALWDIGDGASEAMPQLREALQDPSGLVRLYAAGALRGLDEDDAVVVPALQSVLRSASPWNRAYAVVQLLEMRTPMLELRPAIESVLFDPTGTRADRYELDIFEMKVDAVADDPNVEAKRMLLEALESQRSLPADLVPALEFAGKNLDSTVRLRALSELAKVK
jgi:HEAT repeat protein